MKVLIIGGGCGLNAQLMGRLMIGGVVVGSLSNIELSVDGQDDLPPLPVHHFRPVSATFSLEYKGTKVRRGKGKKGRW
jgi:hypothetical protein